MLTQWPVGHIEMLQLEEYVAAFVAVVGQVFGQQFVSVKILILIFLKLSKLKMKGHYQGIG